MFNSSFKILSLYLLHTFVGAQLHHPRLAWFLSVALSSLDKPSLASVAPQYLQSRLPCSLCMQKFGLFRAIRPTAVLGLGSCIAQQHQLQ
ncbi:uncharacterized protein M421DRAFT_171240 [Didymella exigua CBS 183.55]|uniref:Secreted protein n=1 Tax=Didymella exigua CBS 183.55 TaxID=1150837 RepID=A0A6A5RKH1_9PLEO|nr:uncharacterized protein M421DRAFT_171240 [Didymella exigua CBS 183.55]KAF1927608.1 hypothetical protein M421DRAFT_171240 [Didymella exigua CBS 183.55]